MLPTRRELLRLAASTGFEAPSLERVLRLGEMVARIEAQSDLREQLVLKGGGALHLLRETPRRLSVDLDFNYVGSPDRETMLAERPGVESSIESIAQTLGLSVQKSKDSHAGRKLYLSYTSLLGAPDRIEIDLNYLHRISILAVESANLWRPDATPRPEVRVLAAAELAAGKLCALLDRGAARDLWDVAHLPELIRPWPPPRLRPVFVALSGALPHALPTYDLEKILRLSDQAIRRSLRPILIQGDDDRDVPLARRVRQVVEPLLDLDGPEREFTERLQEGELAAGLLFPDDPDLADRISRHPVLRWKARNAAKHRSKE